MNCVARFGMIVRVRVRVRAGNVESLVAAATAEDIFFEVDVGRVEHASHGGIVAASFQRASDCLRQSAAGGDGLDDQRGSSHRGRGRLGLLGRLVRLYPLERHEVGLGRRLLLCGARAYDAKDAIVEDEHDYGRYVEGEDRRVDLEGLVVEGAYVGDTVWRVVEAGHDGQRDRYADEPQEDDRVLDALGRSMLSVLERLGDRYEAIDGYCHQVEYGSRRGHDIRGYPGVTQRVRHEPLAVGHLFVSSISFNLKKKTGRKIPFLNFDHH